MRTVASLWSVVLLLVACEAGPTPDDGEPESGAATKGDAVGEYEEPCCDPAEAPEGGIEGVYCCADGTWAYDIGNGQACPEDVGEGEVCEVVEACCDPAEEPEPGIEGAHCCADGTWRYDIGNGQACPEDVGEGEVCE